MKQTSKAGVLALACFLCAADLLASSTAQIRGPQDITLPEGSGYISESFTGTSDKHVVLLQDVHANPSAQQNSAAIIQHLAVQHGYRLVLVEGSSGPVDVSLLSRFPDPAIRHDLAKYFVQHAHINAAEFAAVTATTPLQLYGVEDDDLYLGNLAEYRRSHYLESDADQRLAELQPYAAALKEHVFTAEQKVFLSNKQKYDDEELDLSNYLLFLLQRAPKDPDPQLTYPKIHAFLDIVDIEKAIEWPRVGIETQQALAALLRILPATKQEEVQSKWQEYQQQGISQTAFYEYLASLAPEELIDFRSYPNLERYLKRVRFTLDPAALLSELDSLQAAVGGELFSTGDPRDLRAALRHLELLTSLVHLRMSNEELDEFERAALPSDKVLDQLATLASKYGVAIPSHLTAEHALTVERIGGLQNFYAFAYRRDEAFARNGLQRMEQVKSQRAILFHGGFHTKGVKQQLKQRGVSYIQVTPGIDDSAAPRYKARVLNKKTRVELLLDEGEDDLMPPSPFKPLAYPELARIFRRKAGIFGYALLIRHLKSEGLPNAEIQSRAEQTLGAWKDIYHVDVAVDYGGIVTIGEDTLIPVTAGSSSFYILLQNRSRELPNTPSVILERGHLTEDVDYAILSLADGQYLAGRSQRSSAHQSLLDGYIAAIKQWMEGRTLVAARAYEDTRRQDRDGRILREHVSSFLVWLGFDFDDASVDAKIGFLEQVFRPDPAITSDIDNEHGYQAFSTALRAEADVIQMTELRHYAWDPNSYTQLDIINLDGEGDAILVKSPGDSYIVIDAGLNKRAAEHIKASSQPSRPKVRVLITHPHQDHIRGLSYLLDDPEIEVEEIILCNFPQETRLMGTLLNKINQHYELVPLENSGRYLRVYKPRGAEHTWTSSVSNAQLSADAQFLTAQLRIDSALSIHLAQYQNPSNPNQSSILTRLEHKGKSHLLTGDIDQLVLKRLVEAHMQGQLGSFDLHAGMLKWPHHIAFYPTDGQFLDAMEHFLRTVRPHTIYLSNHHWTQDTERVNEIKKFIYRVLGPKVRILFTVDDGTIRAITMKERKATERLAA